MALPKWNARIPLAEWGQRTMANKRRRRRLRVWALLLFAAFSAGIAQLALGQGPPAGSYLWSKRFGSTSGDEGCAVAVDASGNVVVSGYFSGTVDFGSGPLTSAGGNDIFVAKFSGTDGSHIWSKRLGSTGDDQGWALAVDGSGNVVVAGTFRGTVDFGGGSLASAGGADIFVAKFNGTNGAHLWSKRLGSTSDDQGRAVAVDAAGSILVVGHFSGTVDFGGGPITSASARDNFVAKFSGADGSHLWSKGLGSAGQFPEWAVAADASGNVVVTGAFQGTVDLGGGALTSAGADDIFVAKFQEANGAHLWSKSFGGASYDDGKGVAVDNSGNVVVTGPFNGTVDFGGGPLTSAGLTDMFLIKLSGADGTHLWSKHFGGTGWDDGHKLATDSSGNVLVTSFFQGTVDFGGGPLVGAGNDDIFVAKFSGADGAHLWSKGFVSASGKGRSPMSDTSGNVVVTGYFSGTVDFGGGTMTSAGGSDIFVVKLSGGVPTPAVSLAPSSLDFGNQLVGTTSAAKSVTLTNSGSATLNITSISLSGADSNQFAQTNNCGATLAVSASCTISATFAPTSVGAKSAGVTIASDAAGSPHTVPLTGNGTVPAPAVTLAPTSLSFGNQLINTMSAAQIVTLSNSGTATLNITAITLSGTNSSEFAQTNNCGATLAVSANCAISVTFAPSSAGAKAAAVSITSDAPGGPHSVPLTGSGVTPPAVSLSASSVTFSAQIVNTTSAAQTITLTNTGGSALSIASLTVTGANAAEFTKTDNCGASLRAGGNCTISLTFRPTGAGNCTASLTIQHNAAGGPHTVNLTGTGTDFSVAAASGSSTSATVNAGQTATYQLNLAGTAGFSGTVTLTCAGAPTAATCALSSNSVTLSGATPAAVTVTVTTTARSWLPPSRAPRGPLPLLPFAALLFLTWLWAVYQRQPRFARALLRTAALAAVVILAGCGSGGGSSSPPPPPGTPAGTYSITVTASTQQGSQPVNRTMNLTLVVQ